MERGSPQIADERGERFEQRGCMDNNSATAAKTRAPARRVAVLVCVIALAAAAGVFGARLVPHDWRASLQSASLQSSAALFGRTGSGPAGFADIVDAVKPAVIGVQTKRTENEQSSSETPADRFLREFGAPQLMPETPGGRHPARMVTTQGSGFFISADGYAVTNNHVIEGTKTAEIQTDDQKTYTAKVVGTDPISDLALLKVDGRSDFAFVKLADEMPRVGDWVLAVGNPFGLGGTVTAGIVSARERNIGGVSSDSLLQIDAPINKGDSGGPTFDLNGRVIGVNMMIFSPSGGSIGIAFAIPAATVRTVMSQLREKGSVTRGWLGVQIQPVTAEIADVLGLKQAQGALVAEAQAEGPAAKAGITSGDVIGSVDGTPIRDPSALSKTIASIAPGTSVKLSVLREGKERSIAVALGELPVPRQTPAASKQQQGTDEHETIGRGDASDLGLQLAPAGSIAGAGEQGVVVTDIDPAGLWAERGFELGDVILEVGGKSVKTPAEIEGALSEARSAGKRTVLLRLRSGDSMRFVTVPIG
jgi:serine protease Do